MRRSPRVWLAWTAAALVTLITLRVVATDLATLHKRAQALGHDVSVMVAVRDLPLGATIQATDVRALTRPSSTVPLDALHDARAAIGRVVSVALLRDDIVRAAHLVAPGRHGLDGVVPNGWRAVHVVVKDGFRPPLGAVVDIVAAFDPSSSPADEARGAVVVARAARVLAADEGADAGASAVTLLVPEAAIAAVASAAAGGEISLAVGPPGAACCFEAGSG